MKADYQLKRLAVKNELLAKELDSKKPPVHPTKPKGQAAKSIVFIVCRFWQWNSDMSGEEAILLPWELLLSVVPGQSQQAESYQITLCSILRLLLGLLQKAKGWQWHHIPLPRAGAHGLDHLLAGTYNCASASLSAEVGKWSQAGEKAQVCQTLQIDHWWHLPEKPWEVYILGWYTLLENIKKSNGSNSR